METKIFSDIDNQVKIIDSSMQGGILTLNMDKPTGKIGRKVDLDFEKAIISGTIIKKIGKKLKVRVSSIRHK